MLHWQFKTILSWKFKFAPVTPSDPRLTVDPITLVDGLKVMYMHESYGQAILHVRDTAFLSKNNLLNPVTPIDPGWISRPITFVEGI